jgi:hypothetical protein
MTAPTKPPATLPKRLGYFALMLAGVGTMLLAAGGDTAQNKRIVTYSGLAFVVLGTALLVVAGGLDWHRRVFGRREPEPEADTITQTDDVPSGAGADVEGEELTHTERALIKWLRTNDVPPDVVATAIREILERRLGR